jgi:putative ABC transport system permease protein
MKYLMLIWMGLWRTRLRTGLTVLSILIAFLLFGLLQGINQGMGSVVSDLHVDRLYVFSKISMSDSKGLPLAMKARLESVSGVRKVTHWTYFAGFYRDSAHPLSVFATDVQSMFSVYPELEIPVEQLTAMQATRSGAVISKSLADKHGWKIGDKVPVGSTIWAQKGAGSAWSFEIVGVYRNPGGAFTPPDTMYVDYDYFDEARTTKNGTVNLYIVSIANPFESTRIANSIDASNANSGNETRTQTEQVFAQTQIKQLADINLIVNSIVSAVMFTLLFMTGNSVMQSFRERIPEFAVLKTLGFSDARVLMLVLGEASFLCLGPAALGLASAFVLFPFLGRVFGIQRPPFAVIVVGMAIAALLAAIAGLPPALRAKRLNIVDALAGR